MGNENEARMGCSTLDLLPLALGVKWADYCRFGLGGLFVTEACRYRTSRSADQLGLFGAQAGGSITVTAAQDDDVLLDIRLTPPSFTQELAQFLGCSFE